MYNYESACTQILLQSVLILINVNTRFIQYYSMENIQKRKGYMQMLKNAQIP